MSAGHDYQVLFATQFIGHRVSKAAGRQFGGPQLLAIFETEGTEAIVGSCTDKNQPTTGDIARL